MYFALFCRILTLIPACCCLKLATKTTITEVNGKAVACVSGVLSVKRKAFVLEPPPNDPETPDQDARVIISPETKAKLPGKRKVASVSAPITTHPLEYRERSSMLLGQVDEDKLMKQIKAVRISKLSGEIDLQAH